MNQDLKPPLPSNVIGERDTKSSRSGQGNATQGQGREELDHLHLDLAPPMSPAVEVTGSSMLTRQDSMQQQATAANLPPDTSKFLKFAGQLQSGKSLNGMHFEEKGVYCFLLC